MIHCFNDGKCGLYEHISFEKMYDKGSYKVSDELECFEIFKKKTGGVIYQHREIVVSEWNQQYVKDHCKDFDFTEHTREVEDKRVKAGKRTEKYFTYTYWGTEYNSLKELNKHGVFIEVQIHFDTLLDIIPYYGHIVVACSSREDSEYVVISNENHAILEYNRSLKVGGTMNYPAYVYKNISEHIQEVTNLYYNYKLEERTKRVSLLDYKPLHNGWYEILIAKGVDRLHKPKFVWADGKTHMHWSNPKVSDTENYVLLVSEQDIDYYLAEDIKNGNVYIEYVVECKLPNEVTDNL